MQDFNLLQEVANLQDNTLSVDSDLLKELSELAHKFISMQNTINEKEEELKALKKDFQNLSEKAIPNLLSELGLSEIKTEDGLKISVKSDVYAKITDENKKACFEWLNNNGFSDIIKTEVLIKYDKSEHEKALSNYQALINKGFNASFSENVHHATLKSFIKEQLKKGSDIPLNLFSAYEFNKTTIK